VCVKSLSIKGRQQPLAFYWRAAAVREFGNTIKLSFVADAAAAATAAAFIHRRMKKLNEIYFPTRLLPCLLLLIHGQ